MSRQSVLDRRGQVLGIIDTDPRGLQVAITRSGSQLGRFDPRTNQTFDPAGNTIAEGNSLPAMLRRAS